ncbi:MAG: sensor histidine kinase [Syntrophomonas sp.]
MSLKEYLLDQRYLIIFYITLMAFVTAVVYLDPAVKIWIEDILYMNIGAFFLFFIYLSGSYWTRRKYYRDINALIHSEQNEAIYSLPEPINNGQKLFQQLLIKMYSIQKGQIEQAYAEKKENFEYICSWVHEIKTPISVSTLLIEKNKDGISEDYLSSLDEEIKKIDGLVEQVLYYSRLEDFAHDYFINECDVRMLVNETIKKHAKIFINRNIRIELGMLDITVTSDKKWLLFILDQIVSNSLKYSPQGGLINIFAEKDEKEKSVIIEDNGVGIKAEDIERVFDRGFTGYNGRLFGKSTGMGLYLVKKLARKLGHDVTIESVYGEYTRVIIHFPKLGDYLKV